MLSRSAPGSPESSNVSIVVCPVPNAEFPKAEAIVASAYPSIHYFLGMITPCPCQTRYFDVFRPLEDVWDGLTAKDLVLWVEGGKVRRHGSYTATYVGDIHAGF